MKQKKAFQLFTIIVLIIFSSCTPMNGDTQAQNRSERDGPIEGNTITASTNAETSASRAAITDENTVSDLQSEGTILFAPLRSTTTYLINSDGEVVHTWPSTYYPGNAVYLLENGDLLHTGSLRSETFDAGGSGGIVQQINWQGDVVWEFEYAGEQGLLHHDIEPLPDGNILMIAWEYKTAGEALAAGRDPDLLKDGALWPDTVIEVDPTSNRIVWEWHVWDHLVQDLDPAKPGYGDPSEHPELVDINYTAMNVADWNHINAIDYNSELDQILLSVHNFSEIWIIDHSTTTEEAAGHTAVTAAGAATCSIAGATRRHTAPVVRMTRRYSCSMMRSGSKTASTALATSLSSIMVTGKHDPIHRSRRSSHRSMQMAVIP